MKAPETMTSPPVFERPKSPMPQADPGGKPRGGTWVIVAVVLVVAIGGVLLLHRQSKATAAVVGQAGKTPPALQVTMATAQKGDVGVYVPGIGLVTPVYTV